MPTWNEWAKQKLDTYETVRELTKGFKTKYGTLKCGKLLDERAKEDPAYKKATLFRLYCVCL